MSLPKAGYDGSDAEVVFRTQVVVLYAITTAFVASVYAFSHWERGALGLTLLFALFASATVVQLGALRWTGRVALVAHSTLAVAMVCTTAATYLTGGLRMTNVCPFFIVIVSAIFLLGWKGLPWSASAILVPVAFEVASASGVRFPDHVPPADRAADALLTWLVAIVVVFLFVVCYEAARLLSLRRRMEAEAARAQFLASVSHELRTPLHAVMGMTDRALRTELSREAREALETSRHNADGLLVLIADLLDLASMQRDRFVLHDRDFDPVSVVERVERVVRYRCEDKGLTFECSVDPAVPRWVHGDGDRLQQVLTNLGSNAVKYTAEGSVVLEVAREETDSEDPTLRFSVSDTGIGIGDRDRASLFDPFTQLNGSTGRSQDGAGLGLSIVRQIVAAMDGRVQFESEPGRGSTFHVIVPLEPARSAPPEDAPSSEHPPSERPSLRVLLVDDDRVNLQMGELMLAELHHQVVVARDGQQAIEQWSPARPDVVLMDLQMPGMDGLEAIRRIRRQEEAEQRNPVPILAVTGHGTAEHRAKCLSAGADDCLFKPFRIEDLRDALGRAALAP
ncbi:MAG: response regulator [Deltaproteobacteria bacterium]|nr:response regulator [Deltaproteobacteria bacterium]MBW2536331.1 response regulator [Deltaproteobacteria bacterium]